MSGTFGLPISDEQVAQTGIDNLAEADAQAALPKKTVRLQVNNSGAWKNIVTFDAANDEFSSSVMLAAAMLGTASAHDITFRIVIPDTYPEVLTSWSRSKGWVQQ